MSRRIIESSDGEDDLGPYAAHLTQTDEGGFTLSPSSDARAFIEAITSNPSNYQKLAIISACRAMGKKDHIKLFKGNKAAIVFGIWWDHCLLKLSSAENGAADKVIKVMIELLKFATELNEVVKSKADLGKAKTRFGIDLVRQLEATKAIVEDDAGKISGIGVKARLLLAEKHFVMVYETTIVAKAKSLSELQAAADTDLPAPAQQANNSVQAPAPAPQADNASAPNSSGHSDADRRKAAQQKRMEMLKDSQKKRAGVGLASPAKPSAASSNNGGSMPPPNGMGGSNPNDGRQPPGSGAVASFRSIDADRNHPNSSSGGYDRHQSSAPAVINASASGGARASAPASASAYNIMQDDGSNEGWGRRPPTDSPPLSDTARILLHRDKTDTRQWGPSLRGRQIPPYEPEQQPPPRADPEMNRRFEPRDRPNDSRSGYDSQSNRQPSNYAPRDQSRVHGYNNDSRQLCTSNSRDHERDYRSNDSRDNRQPYDFNPNRPSYDSSRPATYDSQSSRQPYPDRTDSSDTQPYTHGGNIRNNQPGRNTGTGYQNDRRDEYRSNDASQSLSRSDEGSRRGSEYDRRDSRVSSYSNRSSDRPVEDRREFEERRRRSDSRPSSYRSDSPPGEHRGLPRSYADDKRRDEDRFDDRRKRDRDDSGRGGGGGSRSLCKYFFSLRGCRNGSGCRFSHEESGDRKPPSDRLNERVGRGRDRTYEDGGSEDGEVRPVKRFRGPDRDNMQSSAGNSSNQPSAAGGGRGRGRGAHVNKPAWMTQAENGSGPVGASSIAHAPAPIANTQPAGIALNNTDLANLLSSVTPAAPTIPTGRGRGNVDNRPAWMTAAENGPSGATSVSAPPANAMNGRFAPPPAAHQSNAPPSQRSMGRGRGRGAVNKPAWMDQAEWDNRNA
jgi:hypothetical protein